MRVRGVTVRPVEAPLSRPYAIAGHRYDAVSLLLVTITADGGARGHGQASPAPEVTGETAAACAASLQPTATEWLLGRDVADPALPRELAERCPLPAARAALDMALLDLQARAAGRPLVDLFGRRPGHVDLPTSITIGLLPVAATLREAEEHVARGFRSLKIKTGGDVDEDCERLRRLRARFGSALGLRADANMGYDERALRRFAPLLDELDLELLEQPLPRGQEDALRALPATAQRRLVADESVLDDQDLARLLDRGCPFGLVNVKLMKCGGPRAALQLAARCARHGLSIFWGCMDESVLGIAAALHTAYACTATRHLDLDGSFDLAADPFVGGFALRDGCLATLPAAGLGADPVDPAS